MGSGKYKTLTKNTLLFTISSIGTKLISFLLVPLYTFVLSTEDYGTVDLMTTTISMLLPILSVNVQDAVLRYSLEKKQNPENVISVAMRIIFMGSFLLACVLLVIQILGVFEISYEYLLFLWIHYTSNAIFNSLQMYLKATDRVRVIVIASIASTIVSCVLNIVLLLGFKMGVIGYLIALASASIVSNFICLFTNNTYKDIHLSYKNKELRNMMVAYCAPLILNSLAWWINSASDRYILTFFRGASSNGIYSVSYKIPTILSTLQTIFYNAWSVSAIKEFDKHDKDGFIGNIYSLYSCMSIIGCSFIMILNPFLARVLYAKDFYQAWQYVPALLIGTVFNGLSLVEGCLFTAVKKTKTVSSTTLVGAAVNTILNFILIYSIGIQGAAIATMAGYIVVWIVRTIKLNNHVIKMHVKWELQILALCLLIFQGVIATAHGFTILQFLMLALIIIIQFKFVREILQMIIRKFNHSK